jgi:hypothetical protein
MNEKSLYFVHKKKVVDTISNNENVAEGIAENLTKYSINNPDNKRQTSIDLNFYIDGIEKITMSNLQNIYDSTCYEVVDMLMKYYKAKVKIQRYKKMLEYANDNDGDFIYVNPTFTINSANSISISNPILPFTICEIQELFGFQYAIEFHTIEEIVNFCTTCKPLIYINDLYSNFLVVNRTLYVRLYTFSDFKDIKRYSYDTKEKYNTAVQNIKELISLMKFFYNFNDSDEFIYLPASNTGRWGDVV